MPSGLTRGTLRAACGGGLRPCLTVAARVAHSNSGRDQETAGFSRTKKPLTSELLAAAHVQPDHPQGAHGSDGTKVRTWIGTLRFVIAHRSAPQCLEPVPRNPSGPAVIRPHSTGRIHDRSRPQPDTVSCFLPNGGRPYMTLRPITLLRLGRVARRSPPRRNAHYFRTARPAKPHAYAVKRTPRMPHT